MSWPLIACGYAMVAALAFAASRRVPKLRR